jgi:hypothetical protein
VIYFGEQAGDLEGIVLCTAKNLRRRSSSGNCQTSFSVPVSDVKIRIGDFLCHVREYAVAAARSQNADTGVFSLGDFWRDPAPSLLVDLRRDRVSQCAQMDMVFLVRFSVVNMIEFRFIFPETDTVFCETDMVWIPVKGNGG